MPRVSVIMATYNCEKTVRESIESIMNQSFTDWEFIICDDGSSDGTYSVLCEYIRKNIPINSRLPEKYRSLILP